MNNSKAWHNLGTLAELAASVELSIERDGPTRIVCRNTAEPKKLRALPRALNAVEWARRELIKRDVAFVKCLRRQITNRERKGDMSLFSREVGQIWEEKCAGLRKLGYTKRL